MKRPYLLGFMRGCIDLPSEPPFSTKLTTVGDHSVIWSESPKRNFLNKQAYLLAMLQWINKIQNLQLTVLPIQAGVSVSDELYLEVLLTTYKQELESCFDKVNGCSEYCLTLTNRKQDSPPLGYSSLSMNVQSGKDYLERMRLRHQQLDKKACQVREVIDQLCLRLSPWIRDQRFEVSQTPGAGITLGLLVSNTFKEEIIQQLDTLCVEVDDDYTKEWTGPWPPFHFSSFSLKPESFLIRESLNWE